MSKSLSILILSIFGLISVFFVGCTKNTEKDALQGTIEIAGSSTVFPITTAMAEEFIIINQAVNIPVRSTGTGGGFKNFFTVGLTDINNASRPIKNTERAAAKENGIETIEFQVAIDAITIVVNQKSPVNDITVAQLNMIWHPDKAAVHWNEVDPTWPQAKLELYGPSSASGTFDYFSHIINGQEGLSRADYQKTEQDNTIVQAVMGSTSALGYFGLAYYLENKDRIKALTLNGIAPSMENARNGLYTPLSRPIFIYVSSKALSRPEVRTFVRYYIENTVSSIISDVGYVPVTEDIKNTNLVKLEEAIALYTPNSDQN